MSLAPCGNSTREKSENAKVRASQRPSSSTNTPSYQRQPQLTTEQRSESRLFQSAKHDALALDYYPAYCHKASKTWFTWVKLTAYDVHHRLQARAGFHHSLQSVPSHFRDAPQVLFFLNHPIQFVQVAGVVVNFEEHFQKFWLLTIDDSSGETVDVICKKPEEDDAAATKAADLVRQVFRDEQDDAEAALRVEARKLTEVMRSSVAVGTILQVKGTITLFHRNITRRIISEVSTTAQQDTSDDQTSLRQISAQRVIVLSTAAAELAFIAARDLFLENVLSQRWILSTRNQERLQQDAYGDTQRESSRAVRRLKMKRQKKEREQREDEEVSRIWEHEEGLRARHAAVARQAAQSLHTNCTSVLRGDSGAESAAADSDRLALLRSAFG